MLINGVAAQQISVFDRGLHYGDGVFETIAVRDRQPQYWQQHLERLKRGCDRLRIVCPDTSLLQMEAEQVCAAHMHGVLKIIVSRGAGGRGYRSDPDVTASRIVAWYPAPGYPTDYASQGVRVRLCATRLAVQPALAGIKHLNRLEQILARQEWDEVDIAEGLMLDCDDNVIEGTMSNIFMVQNGTLYTPELARCGVEGVMRNQVLELAHKRQLPVSIKPMRMADLRQADELFLTSSLINIWPIRELDGITFTPGPITIALTALLAPLCANQVHVKTSH